MSAAARLATRAELRVPLLGSAGHRGRPRRLVRRPFAVLLQRRRGGLHKPARPSWGASSGPTVCGTSSVRCVGCGLCIATCPAHALLAAQGAPRLVAWRCTQCLECLEVCPADAIVVSDGAR
jgi:ferredoxin